MENSNVHTGRIPEGQAMRMHRLLIGLTLIVFLLTEAMVITTLGATSIHVSSYVAWLLPVVVAMPLAVTFLSYRGLKKHALLSGGEQCDWHLVRFWWALLIVIFYSSLLAILTILMR